MNPCCGFGLCEIALVFESGQLHPPMWAIQTPITLCQLAEWRTQDRGLQAPGQFACSGFWRLCRWSPDGTSLLAVHDDNSAHIITVPSSAAAAVFSGQRGPAVQCSDLKPSLTLHTGENNYDVQWYPGCNFQVEQTACVAETSRGKPITLWDASYGSVRATYRTHDGAHEVTTCHSLCFHQDCERCDRCLTINCINPHFCTISEQN